MHFFMQALFGYFSDRTVQFFLSQLSLQIIFAKPCIIKRMCSHVQTEESFLRHHFLRTARYLPFARRKALCNRQGSVYLYPNTTFLKKTAVSQSRGGGDFIFLSSQYPHYAKATGSFKESVYSPQDTLGLKVCPWQISFSQLLLHFYRSPLTIIVAAGYTVICKLLWKKVHFGFC